MNQITCRNLNTYGSDNDRYCYNPYPNAVFLIDTKLKNGNKSEKVWNLITQNWV